MLQQVSNPFAVLCIRLASRYRLDMVWVHQHLLKMSFQHRPDRSPVNSRSFHSYVSYSVLLQPVRQLQQVLRERAEHPRLLLLFVPAFAHADASADGFLMYIESRATLIHDLHGFPPGLHPEEAFVGESPSRARHQRWRLQFAVPLGFRVRL